MENQMMSSSMVSQDNAKQYYSIQPTTKAQAVVVYNAVNNPDYRISDFINKTIEVEHVLIEMVELANEKTGEIESVPRTVLLDNKGKSYVAVSFGVYNSMKRVIQMFGEPAAWDGPIKIEVKQIKKGENSILTLSIIG